MVDCLWEGDGSRETRGNRHDGCHWGGKNWRKTVVATLLERFKENPVETRHDMRVELGFIDELAAEMFALVVFVSDGLLQINDDTTPSPAARFFAIAAQLPLNCKWCCASARWDQPRRSSPARRAKRHSRNWQRGSDPAGEMQWSVLLQLFQLKNL